MMHEKASYRHRIYALERPVGASGKPTNDQCLAEAKCEVSIISRSESESEQWPIKRVCEIPLLTVLMLSGMYLIEERMRERLHGR